MNNQTDGIVQENKSQDYINCFQGAEDLLKNIDNKDKKEKIKDSF